VVLGDSTSPVSRLPGVDRRYSSLFHEGSNKQYCKCVNERNNKQPSGREANVRFQILDVAKQLVAGRLGVIAAARQLSPLRHEAEPQVAEVLLTFAGIDSETDVLPIGKVREAWNPEALKRKEHEIVEAEQFYRASAMNAAAELIRLLDVPS
jgi:hypothetical protein